MKRFMQVAALILLNICISCTMASAAAMFQQVRCGPEMTVCISISPSTQFPLVLRSFVFNVGTTAGKAQTSFQGSMVCSSVSSTPAVVDLVTQIGFASAIDPDPNLPGGAR